MLTLVPEPRKRLVPEPPAKGRKPGRENEAVRMVVDDHGDAVKLQWRCSSCTDWHSNGRGWCMDCRRWSSKQTRERDRGRARELARRARLRRYQLDPMARVRDQARNTEMKRRFREANPVLAAERRSAANRRWLERVRSDPGRYRERVEMMRVDNVLRRMDAGLATGFGRRLKGTSPEWERKYVPSAPLALAVLGQARMTPTELANAAGIDGKVLRNWRTGEQRRATWGSADAVLVALDRFWWEVFDPQDGPHGAFSGERGRDVVAWVAAAEAAVALWEPDEADGEAVEWLAMAGAL